MEEKRESAMKRPPRAPSSEGAVIKSITTALAREGWQIWEENLNQLDAPAGQILIGMEATSRDAGKSLPGVGAARL